MNTLKTKFALTATTLALALAAASSVRATETDDATAVKPLSRAEVQADLQVWRESGLDRWQSLDDPSTFTMPAYLKAQARYQQMCAAPEFAMLVERLGGPSAATVVAAHR